MGLDLALLPFDCDYEYFAFSHTVLDCGRDGELFEAIQMLPTHPVMANFTSYLCRDGDGETHYGLTVVTPYGEPLMYVEAHALLLHTPRGSRGGIPTKNVAIWAYLACLDPQTKVALFWH